MGQRHDLPVINILTVDAAINDEAPGNYAGLDRFDARKKILEDLEALDLLEKIDDHKLMVPRGDRSHAVIEHYLTDKWYVKVAPLAEPAIKAVKDGDIKFVPEHSAIAQFNSLYLFRPNWCNIKEFELIPAKCG